MSKCDCISFIDTATRNFLLRLQMKRMPDCFDQKFIRNQSNWKIAKSNVMLKVNIRRYRVYRAEVAEVTSLDNITDKRNPKKAATTITFRIDSDVMRKVNGKAEQGMCMKVKLE